MAQETDIERTPDGARPNRQGGYDHEFDDFGVSEEKDAVVTLADTEPDEEFEEEDESQVAGAEEFEEEEGEGDEGEGDDGGGVQAADDLDERVRHAVEQAVEPIRRENIELKRASTEQAYERAKQEHETKVAEKTERMKALRDDMAKAMEDGETDKYLELQEEYTDTLADRKILLAQSPKEDDFKVEAPAKPPTQSNIPKKAQEWIEQNPWFNDPRHASRKQLVLAIDSGLTAEGYDPQTDEYYEELEARFEKKHPGFLKKKGKPPASPGASRRGKGSGDAGKSVKNGKVRITKDDKANMRRFGLDPDNRDHLRAYAREKAAGSSTEMR